MARYWQTQWICPTGRHRILEGTRGKPPLDREALVEVLLKVSALAMDHADRIDELDINPLLFPQGACAVEG